MKIDIVGTADVAFNLGNIANPEGCDIFIVEGWIWLEEGAHAAATVNIGIGASGADTVQLVAAFPWNGADDTFWTVVARGASEATAEANQNGVQWPAASFLTVTNAAQASTGLIAHLYLRYIRLE
jgi:hypothetical protein